MTRSPASATIPAERKVGEGAQHCARSARATSRGFEPLPSLRLAELKRLRDAVRRHPHQDRYASEGVSRQSRQAPATFTARATFANFYEAGGIETIGNDGFKNRDDARRIQGVGRAARVPVLERQGLCGGRRRSAQALSTAGAVVHLAGGPRRARSRVEHRVTYCYSRGCDVCATLTATMIRSVSHEPDSEFRRPSISPMRVQRAAPRTPWMTPRALPSRAGPRRRATSPGSDALDTYPGKPPYLRGPYPAMYAAQPMDHPPIAGFSTAEVPTRCSSAGILPPGRRRWNLPRWRTRRIGGWSMAAPVMASMCRD